MRTSGRCRRSATLIALPICAVGTRGSRRRQNHCQTDHENLCHFNLSNKTTYSCRLFNTAPGDSARPFFHYRQVPELRSDELVAAVADRGPASSMPATMASQRNLGRTQVNFEPK